MFWKRNELKKTTLRLTCSQRKKLAKAAEKAGFSWASIVRELIDKYL